MKYVLCDLDGTLALLGDRSPYDASTCEHDELNEGVCELLWTLTGEDEGGVGVIFVSGRMDTWREETLRWLEKAGFIDATLFMRKEGDYRPDQIVKREILKEEIYPLVRGVNGRVWFVLDDRNKVVQMWREEGLLCLQVADGNF